MVFPCPKAPLFSGVADLHSTSGMCLLDFPCCTLDTFHVQITASWSVLFHSPTCPSFVCHIPGGLLFLPVPSLSRNTEDSVNLTPVFTGQSPTTFALLLLKECLIPERFTAQQ